MNITNRPCTCGDLACCDTDHPHCYYKPPASTAAANTEPFPTRLKEGRDESFLKWLRLQSEDFRILAYKYKDKPEGVMCNHDADTYDFVIQKFIESRLPESGRVGEEWKSDPNTFTTQPHYPNSAVTTDLIDWGGNSSPKQPDGEEKQWPESKFQIFRDQYLEIQERHGKLLDDYHAVWAELQALKAKQPDQSKISKTKIIDKVFKKAKLTTHQDLALIIELCDMCMTEAFASMNPDAGGEIKYSQEDNAEWAKHIGL